MLSLTAWAGYGQAQGEILMHPFRGARACILPLPEGVATALGLPYPSRTAYCSCNILREVNGGVAA